MDRLWYRKVSHSSISTVLTSSPIRRNSVDGVVRDTFSICRSGVSVSQMMRVPMTNTSRQNLLMKFLSVLSMIEGMYSFGRDISAE